MTTNMKQAAMEYLDEAFAAADRAIADRLEKAKAAGEKVACGGPGCHWCCYDVAMISELEAVRLIDAALALPEEMLDQILEQGNRYVAVHREHDALIPVVETDADVEKMVERELNHVGLNPVQMAMSVSREHDTPCMFLIDGACSVYEDRPFACRGHFNLSGGKDECELYTIGKAKMRSPSFADVFAWFMGMMAKPGQSFPMPYGELHAMIDMLTKRQAEKAAREA